MCLSTSCLAIGKTCCHASFKDTLYKRLSCVPIMSKGGYKYQNIVSVTNHGALWSKMNQVTFNYKVLLWLESNYVHKLL